MAVAPTLLYRTHPDLRVYDPTAPRTLTGFCTHLPAEPDPGTGVTVSLTLDLHILIRAAAAAAARDGMHGLRRFCVHVH